MRGRGWSTMGLLELGVFASLVNSSFRELSHLMLSFPSIKEARRIDLMREQIVGGT